MAAETEVGTEEVRRLTFADRVRSVKEAFKHLNRGPMDVVAIDVGSTGIKAVRMRKGGAKPALLGVTILPPLDLPKEKPAATTPAKGGKDGKDSKASAEEDEEDDIPRVELPPHLHANYALLTATADEAVVKLLSFPGQFDETAEGKIMGSMGVEEGADVRVSYKLISEGHGRTESVVLAVAMPNKTARIPLALVPSGLPAPYSLEVSGLASMSAFLHGPGSEHEADSVGAIDFGARVSYFGLFVKNRLALIRKFNIGTESIVDRVESSLGVDRDTARGILTDGSFDLSQTIAEIMDSFVKQLIISREFVERRYNSAISSMYLSGGVAGSRDWVTELQSAFGMDVLSWSPLDTVTVAEGVYPPELVGQEFRFTAAIGAALGTFEDT